ncbi:MAG TPA: GTPase ObgE [Candidatus Saccharimonadales bacterium]|nr:GTPase ObgE [Candidatus Saccharimonadales bacterium]
MSFVDRVKVTIKAGDGGDGVTSFRHEKFRARGGPDGGDGGDGGDVILRASRNQDTLAAFRYKKRLAAQDGQRGGKAKRHGKSGEALEVDVPVGTLVTGKSGNVLADFTADGQAQVLARGGKGGFGNAHFVSSTRQAPRVAEKGEKGQEIEAEFELKMIADVGLVGLPNAGKSTLLSVISNAKPEIADYPFTTLAPNLGMVDLDKDNSLLIADIPGLIEGASQGKGLGDEFLRHVERTSVLAHLIDAYSQDPAADYKTIVKELKAYDADLSRRPQVVVLTKIDGIDSKHLSKQLEALKKIIPKNTPLTAISSLNREGINEFLHLLQKKVYASRQKEQKKKSRQLPIIGLKEEDSWSVNKTDNGFLVTGQKIERFARRTHFGDYYGEQRLFDILRKEGITKELERQGIGTGQEITIGEPAIGTLEY